MKPPIVLLCAILLFANIGSSIASAGVIISFDPSMPSPLLAASSGTIDVLIQSDASDTLDFFEVKLALTPLALSLSGGVQFSSLQSDAQLTAPNYVFSSGSLARNTSAAVGTSTGGTFSGSDQTDDGMGGAIPVMLTTMPQLLFRLNLDALSPGSYSIDVVRDFTSFSGDQFDPVNTPILFSSTSGTITVAGDAAVPEPSSAVLLGLACVFGLLLRHASKKRHFREAE